MNNRFIHPLLYNEKLNNGKKITNLTFIMNPFREPINRINHFKYLFEKKDLINGTGAKNNKEYYIKSQKPKQDEYSYHLKVKENQIPNFFKNLCKRRIRDIHNKNGVIISRHFRVMNINSREFPEEKKRQISSALSISKIKNNRSKNHSVDLMKNNNRFFSTELNSFDNRFIGNNNNNLNILNNNFINIGNGNNYFTPINQNGNNIKSFYIGNKKNENCEEFYNGYYGRKNELDFSSNTSGIYNNYNKNINTRNNYKKLKEGLAKSKNDFSTYNKNNLKSKTYNGFKINGFC